MRLRHFKLTSIEPLAGLVDVCCVVYLDDILVYSDTHAQQRAQHLRARAGAAQEVRPVCQLEEMQILSQHEVAFLGLHRRNGAGVSMDREQGSHSRRSGQLQRLLQRCPESSLDSLISIGGLFASYSKIVAPLTSLSKGSKNGK